MKCLHWMKGSLSTAPSASFIARICSAESVLRICASCLGKGANPPLTSRSFPLPLTSEEEEAMEEEDEEG